MQPMLSGSVVGEGRPVPVTMPEDAIRGHPQEYIAAARRVRKRFRLRPPHLNQIVADRAVGMIHGGAAHGLSLLQLMVDQDLSKPSFKDRSEFIE